MHHGARSAGASTTSHSTRGLARSRLPTLGQCATTGMPVRRLPDNADPQMSDSLTTSSYTDVLRCAPMLALARPLTGAVVSATNSLRRKLVCSLRCWSDAKPLPGDAASAPCKPHCRPKAGSLGGGISAPIGCCHSPAARRGGCGLPTARGCSGPAVHGEACCRIVRICVMHGTARRQVQHME